MGWKRQFVSFWMAWFDVWIDYRDDVKLSGIEKIFFFVLFILLFPSWENLHGILFWGPRAHNFYWGTAQAQIRSMYGKYVPTCGENEHIQVEMEVNYMEHLGKVSKSHKSWQECVGQGQCTSGSCMQGRLMIHPETATLHDSRWWFQTLCLFLPLLGRQESNLTIWYFSNGPPRH